MTENTVVQEQTEIEAIQAEDTILEVPVYPEPESDPTYRTSKKKTVFWKLLIAYFALLIALAAVGLWFFYNHLQAYEATTPNAALESYLQWIRDGEYQSIYAASDFEETILNTDEEFIKYLERIYEGDTDTLTVREKSTSTDERKDYSLYIEGEHVSNLTLLKNPEWGETAWSYVTEVVYQPTTAIYAAENMRISVNGVDISLLNLPAQAVQTTVLGSTDDAEALPSVYCYTLENLLNPPTIEALTLSGDICTVTQADAVSYHVYYPTSELLRTEREELAKNTAFTYAEFVARDAKLKALQKLIYEDSELYDTVSSFDDYWTTKHDGYTFEDVVVSGYSQYTDTDFSCEVSFRPVYTQKKQVIEDSPVFHCRLTFILVDEEWKLLTLTTIADEPTTDTTA